MQLYIFTLPFVTAAAALAAAYFWRRQIRRRRVMRQAIEMIVALNEGRIPPQSPYYSL